MKAYHILYHTDEDGTAAAAVGDAVFEPSCRSLSDVAHAGNGVGDAVAGGPSGNSHGALPFGNRSNQAAAAGNSDVARTGFESVFRTHVAYEGRAAVHDGICGALRSHERDLGALILAIFDKNQVIEFSVTVFKSKTVG